MALEYLKDTPKQAFRKLERDLLLISPDINLRQFKGMTPRSLEEEIAKLDEEKARTVQGSTYGAWLASEEYVENTLLREALSFLKGYKEDRKEEEVLVPGFTYYRKVAQFGNHLKGERCYFREGKEHLWVPFELNRAVAKALEVLRHGTNDDFHRIYVEMADGSSLTALEKVSLAHLTESSADTLREIEEYCDGRWTGPWPWETPSPYTLRESIEERQLMERNGIEKMQGEFDKLIIRLNEAEMDKYEVIASAEEMSATLEKMVQQVARLGGEGIIVLKDQIRVAMGDDAAEQIEDKFVDPIRAAADALSKLRNTIESTVQSLKAADTATDVAGTAAIGGGLAGDDDLGGDLGDLGTPADALGDEPEGAGELAGDLADISIDGDDGERPMKDM